MGGAHLFDRGPRRHRVFTSWRCAASSAPGPRVRIAFAAVVFPIQRLEIRHLIAAALGKRLDVVNLPAELGIRVAIVAVFHGVACHIPAPSTGLVPVNDATLI